MRIQLKSLILLAGIIVMMTSCNSNQPAVENLAPGVRTCTVKEIIQTSSYSYLRAMEGSKEIWLAIERQEVKKGETYYFIPDMEMPNFKSKELNRTFNSIFFVQKFSDQPILAGKSMPMAASVGKQVIEMKKGGNNLALQSLRDAPDHAKIEDRKPPVAHH